MSEDKSSPQRADDSPHEEDLEPTASPPAARRRPRPALIAAGAAAGALVIGLLAFGLITDRAPEGQGSVVVLEVAPASSGRDGEEAAAPPSEGDEGAAAPAVEDAAPSGLIPPAQPALIEAGEYGPLPKVGPDGRKPWQVYARPFDRADTRPQIALIITEIGLDAAASQAAVERMPGPVTLAIDPYAPAADDWAETVREAGHEILVSLPLESSAFPFRDPGPMALLTDLPTAENLDRLELALSRCTGYVGVLSRFGEQFERDRDSLRPVLAVLSGRGLMYLNGVRSDESLTGEIARDMELPHAAADLWLDDEPTGDGIDRALARLEAVARERSVAVGVGRAYPLTIDRVAAWARSLEQKGIVLIPASAAAGRQFRL